MYFFMLRMHIFLDGFDAMAAYDSCYICCIALAGADNLIVSGFEIEHILAVLLLLLYGILMPLSMGVPERRGS